MIKQCFEDPSLIRSMNDVVITLIPKVDLVVNLKQWRPISLCNKRSGKGWLAIKVDLEKVYDMLKWKFVVDALRDIGLSNIFIHVVHQCISSSPMRIL